MVGVDASIANAFRRILIAEVPTVAIEHIYVWNNTSVIQDEVLAHRIGLVPLNVDPSVVEWRKSGPGFDGQPNDRNTLVFRYVNISCNLLDEFLPLHTTDSTLSANEWAAIKRLQLQHRSLRTNT